VVIHGRLEAGTIIETSKVVTVTQLFLPDDFGAIIFTRVVA
jgi:hypothetical protein